MLLTVVHELDRWPSAFARLRWLNASKAVSVPTASTNTAPAVAATRPQRSFIGGRGPASSDGDCSSAASTAGVPTAAGAATNVDLILLLPRSSQR